MHDLILNIDNKEVLNEVCVFCDKKNKINEFNSLLLIHRYCIIPSTG